MSPSKYRNQPVEIPGVGRFPSKGEARRWDDLVLLEKSGNIYDLKRQIRFPLHVSGEKIGAYVADFVYWVDDVVDGEHVRIRVVEDYKGMRTPLYRWKKKHFEVEYGTTLYETGPCRTRSASGKSRSAKKRT